MIKKRELLDLNTDILRLVLGNSIDNDEDTLVSLSLTCKKLSNLIISDRHLQKNQLFHKVRQYNSLQSKIDENVRVFYTLKDRNDLFSELRNSEALKPQIKQAVISYNATAKEKLSLIRSSLLSCYRLLAQNERDDDWQRVALLLADIEATPDGNYFNLKAACRNNKQSNIALFILVPILLGIMIYMTYNIFLQINERDAVFLNYLNNERSCENSQMSKNICHSFPSYSIDGCIPKNQVLPSESSLNQSAIIQRQEACQNDYHLFHEQSQSITSRVFTLCSIAFVLLATLSLRIGSLIRSKCSNETKSYQNYPIAFLNSKQSREVKVIQSLFPEAFFGKTIRTISDVTDILKEIYFKYPVHGGLLLLNCRDLIQKINLILSTELRSYPNFQDNTSRNEIFGKANAFFNEFEVFKDRQKKNNELPDELSMTVKP